MPIKEIFDFMNRSWKFIKGNKDLPANNDDDEWDKIIDDAHSLTKDHQTSDPLDRLFRMWVVAILEYMSAVSKGIPTLMQEANEVKKDVT